MAMTNEELEIEGVIGTQVTDMVMGLFLGFALQKKNPKMIIKSMIVALRTTADMLERVLAEKSCPTTEQITQEFESSREFHRIDVQRNE